jgi:hypothetical protein
VEAATPPDAILIGDSHAARRHLDWRHTTPPDAILIGGSHATRLAELSQSTLLSFTREGWRAGRTAVEAVAMEIKENADSFPANSVVVLQLFDIVV